MARESVRVRQGAITDAVTCVDLFLEPKRRFPASKKFRRNAIS
jgi:hypothetical protein